MSGVKFRSWTGSARESVAESLDGFPKEKLHCCNLGADALAKAIKDYENKQ
jgi:nitrogen fixation NifU-like protein